MLGKKYSYEKLTLYNNKSRHTITIKKYFEKKVLDFLRQFFPTKGTVAIFCGNFELYKNLQQTIVHYFSNLSGMKF